MAYDRGKRTREMAQKVKELAAKPYSLIWNPKTHMVGRANRHLNLSSDLHMLTVVIAQSDTQTHTQRQKERCRENTCMHVIII